MIKLSSIPTAEEIQAVIEYLKAWVAQQPSVAGVQSVSGNIVDNSDAANPVVTQVQPDWNASSGLGEILNKPTSAEILGYRRFVGVLSQIGNSAPEIKTEIVNDVNLTNADLKYDDTGIYVIRRPDLMTGLWNQAGVGVVGNNDERTYWVMYPYDSTNQIYFNTYSLDDMALRDDILGFLVELRFPL